ncbi:MAG: COP23 domain-containing protein [Phormidesmis sp.]
MKDTFNVQELLGLLRGSRRFFILSVVFALFLPQETSEASSKNFTCLYTQYGGGAVPATFVQPETGGHPVTLIRWVSEYFSGSGATPQNRCDVVTARLQAFYDNGYLYYIHSDTVNGLPVICVNQSLDRCTGDAEIIVTLPPGTNSGDVLITLTNINQVMSLEPLNLTDELVVFRNNEVYINFEVYVDRASGVVEP